MCPPALCRAGIAPSLQPDGISALREREQTQFTWFSSIVVAKIRNHVALFIDYLILSCNLPRLQSAESRSKGSLWAVGLFGLTAPSLIAIPLLGKILNLPVSKGAVTLVLLLPHFEQRCRESPA